MVLDINGIRDPKFDPDAFQYLVLDDLVKTTIESLALTSRNTANKTESRVFSADLIKGKGEGQVFLLHGSPGVGKTCTAGNGNTLILRKQLLTFRIQNA